MDGLFSLGALVIGITKRFWAAVAVAVMHLTAVVLAIFALASRMRGLVVPSNVLYVVAIAAAFALYLSGRKLDREHPRRETCELLGAVSMFGALQAAAIFVATALGSHIFRV